MLLAQWSLFRSPSSLLFSTMEPGNWKVISLAAGYGHVIYSDQEVEGRHLRKTCLLISQEENKKRRFCYLHYPFFFILGMWIWRLESTAILRTISTSKWQHSRKTVDTIDDSHDNFFSSELSAFGILTEWETYAPYLFKPLFASFTIPVCGCPPKWFEMHIKSRIKQ